MDPAALIGKSGKSSAETEGEKQKRDMQDLKGKSDAQLKELVERQDRILNQKGLVAKLADKGERVRSLKGRIETELASRQEMNSLQGHLSRVVNLSDNMEWNLAAGEDKPVLEETSSDPLLSYLQIRKENVDSYAENMCSKYGAGQAHQGDEAPDRFLPHRSTEAPIMGGKSPSGRSPKSEAAKCHGVQEILIKDSLVLQRKHAQAAVPKGVSQLSSWRQMAATIDSEESDEEMEDQKEEEDLEARIDDEDDPPSVPDQA